MQRITNPAARLMVLITFVSLLTWPLGSCSTRPVGEKKVFKIGLVYIAPHEAVNQVIQGFKDGLQEQMSPGSFEIIEKHANGDTTQLSPTVDATLASGLDLIVPITTPMSQVALKNSPGNVPVCFLAVTDPVGAGLVDSVDKPSRSTGVSDLAPFEAILQFVRQTSPKAVTLGFPYNPEEQPAIFGRDQVLRLGPGLGFKIDAKPMTSKDEFPSLIGRIANTDDVILIGSDNAMFEAAPQIVKVGLDSRKPVFAGDSTSIKAGAVGGYTIDYYQVGRSGSKLAARILAGEKAGNIPVEIMRDGVLELNLISATKLGLQFPDELVQKAKTVYR